VDAVTEAASPSTGDTNARSQRSICDNFLSMCGRYRLSRRKQIIEEYFDTSEWQDDWSPRKEDEWFCTCGNEWNTFDTGGVCPACLHQWVETECLSCSRWSPHSLWYAE
jgi:hypothetical protein